MPIIIQSTKWWGQYCNLNQYYFKVCILSSVSHHQKHLLNTFLVSKTVSKVLEKQSNMVVL